MIRDYESCRYDYSEVILCISKAIDLANPRMYNHQMIVGYIAYCIAKQAGIQKNEDLKDIITAGLLHDIGVLYISKDKKDEIFICDYFNTTDNHAVIGSLMVRQYHFLGLISELIRYHHNSWTAIDETDKIPEFTYIICLADKIAIMIQKDTNIFLQKNEIINYIKSNRQRFCPKYFDAFLSLCNNESFWLSLTDNYIGQAINKCFLEINAKKLNLEELKSFSLFIARLIDFRSPYTYIHSFSVAFVADFLAHECSLSDRECNKIFIAGLLHDIGKLSVPSKILNKPGELVILELDRVNPHSFYTYTILSTIQNIYPINEWAAFHHEKLDGSGYPFHLTGKELMLGSKIMCVADIFSALREARPYKKTYDKDKIIKILSRMVEINKIDKKITDLACNKFSEIEKIVQNTVEKKAKYEYNCFLDIAEIYKEELPR